MEDYSRLRADLEKPIDSHLNLPKRSALNHLNIRTTKALRTRSAQPPDYRYGLNRGEENTEKYDRTRNELNKELDTSLNMNRHTNNRLIRLDITINTEIEEN